MRKLFTTSLAIALVAVLVIGIRFPRPLASIADQNWLRDSIVAAVMF